MSLLRRSLELGFGALLLTKEAADELLEELTDKGGMEKDHAHHLIADIRERGEKLRDELMDSIQRESDEAIKRAGLVKRTDCDLLQQRIEALERRLAELEGRGFETARDL